MNAGKFKVMIGRSGGKNETVKWSYGEGVQANSVQCTACQNWIHKWCSGVRGDVAGSGWFQV